jgi:hypothetical protein
MSGFDWGTAKSTLLRISALEIAEFLRSDRFDGVYGFGYFCHNSYGSVLLTANTTDHHEQSYHDFVSKFGRYDKDHFKWDIGNWKYPAGIGQGPGQQSDQYQRGWRPFAGAIDAAMASEASPGLELRGFCIAVLRQLLHDGVFQKRTQSLGFTVMDVDDREEEGYLTKLEFDSYLRKMNQRGTQCRPTAGPGEEQASGEN